MSNDEIFLTAILNDTYAENIDIVSRIDEYLQACCLKTGCEGLPTPITRIDKLLYELAEKMKDCESGGNKLPIILGGQATVLTAADLEGVTALRDAAFEYYYSLQSIEIPDSVSSIGTACFSWCNALTSVTIPAGISAIMPNTFNECRTLANLTLPATVNSLLDYAFRNTGADVTGGFTLTLLSTTPPAIYTNTFLGVTFKNIIVPKNCGNTYKAAWTAYADKIIESGV